MSDERVEAQRRRDRVENMSDERVEARRQRQRIETRTETCESSVLSSINDDAANYRNAAEASLIFEVCAVCGSEGPNSDYDNLCEWMDRIETSGMRQCFQHFVESLMAGDRYSVAYAEAVTTELNECGLLKDMDCICKVCCKELSTSQGDDNGIDEVEDENSCSNEEESDNFCCNDDSCNEGHNPDVSQCFADGVVHASWQRGIPKRALFLGLFQGNPPEALQGLTLVEASMISVYSNVTRVAMQADVHYHANPTVYTICNDLTNVLSVLPNLPNANSFAILQHRTSIKTTNYQFRPKRVRDALLWLVENNPFYRHIKREWPQGYDWEADESFNDII
jgi:hypothetical protein